MAFKLTALALLGSCVGAHPEFVPYSPNGGCRVAVAECLREAQTLYATGDTPGVGETLCDGGHTPSGRDTPPWWWVDVSHATAFLRCFDATALASRHRTCRW